MSRERVNVDIKNKKTPQALERIFWAKGLQTVLGLDSCVVATTDGRPDVRDFGLQHDVKVLDGKFLARLTKSAKSQQDRISEEEFLRELDDGSGPSDAKRVAGKLPGCHWGAGRLLRSRPKASDSVGAVSSDSLTLYRYPWCSDGVPQALIAPGLTATQC